MYLTTQALVLRVTPYKDHDALLTLLTPRDGRLTAKARGLRRKNSPLVAPCQLLALAEFTLFENNGMYTVNEAQSINLFHGLRKDLVKLSLGSYFAQVAEVISQEDLPNPELLSLVLNCLYVLSDTDKSTQQVKAVFELRCACLAGFTPDLTGCHICDNRDADRFDVSAGILECSSCRSAASDGLRMPVLPAIRDAMRYIVFCDRKRLFAFDTSQQILQMLSQISEVYLTTQLERGFSTLDFYKSLLIPPDLQVH